MAELDICPVTEMLKVTCAHCTGRDGGATARREARSCSRAEPLRRGWIAARYTGRCTGCGDDYPHGTPITSDGVGGWVAACCAP